MDVNNTEKLKASQLLWSSIFSVDSGNLEILFSTKGFAKSDAASDGSRQAGSSSSSRRNGMRQLEKKNYADIDSSRSFGFAYDGNLDLLAVCMVDDGILHSTIYDNKTFRPFRKLVPVKLVTPKRVGMLLGCSNIAVLFNDGHLSVRLDLFDASGTGDPFQELYTVNLLGEVVPEDWFLLIGRLYNNLYKEFFIVFKRVYFYTTHISGISKCWSNLQI